MNSIRSLLCDSLYRIKLLKAGFTGNEIEQLYILDNNLEFVGVNWCNCKKCRSCKDKFIQNDNAGQGNLARFDNITSPHTLNNRNDTYCS